LISYIEGVSPNDVLIKVCHNEASNIFNSIGRTLRKVHTIKLKSFGNPLTNEKIDYHEYLKGKLSSRLNSSKKYLSNIEYDSILSMLNKCDPIVENECSKSPVITHRDVYADNFIIENKTANAYIIDFAMAEGGSPFYDLGKLYISDIYRFPQFHSSFIRGYFDEKIIPRKERSLILYSIILELTGQLGWYGSIKNKKYLEKSLQKIKEISRNEGILWELLFNKKHLY